MNPLFRPATLLLLVFLTAGLCGCEQIVFNSRSKQVQVDMEMIRKAIVEYRAEYGVFPLADPTSELQNNRDLYAILHAPAGPMSGNPKGIGFIDAPSGSLVKGEFIDPWGPPYEIAIDHDGDGKVAPGGRILEQPFVIWTSGPNRIDEHGHGDDYSSWR